MTDEANTIVLPFPPAALSGHAKGDWRRRARVTRTWRAWAHAATLAAKIAGVPATGDIALTVRFYPPDRRSDRANFMNRMKPIFDGVADALKVNDRRFVPMPVYCEPEKPGRVEIAL